MCTGERTRPGVNDLATTHPQEEAERTRNGRGTPRPEFAGIMHDDDTERALVRYVEFVVTANARIADLHHAAALAADSDRSIGAELERTELRRLDDVHTGSAWFVHRGLVRNNEIDEFADVLSYLTSPQTYRYFTVDRGWSVKRFTRWLLSSIHSSFSSSP